MEGLSMVLGLTTAESTEIAGCLLVLIAAGVFFGNLFTQAFELFIHICEWMIGCLVDLLFIGIKKVFAGKRKNME